MRGLILATLWLPTTLSGEEPTSADPLVIADGTAEAIETYIPPKALMNVAQTRIGTCR